MQIVVLEMCFLYILDITFGAHFTYRIQHSTWWTRLMDVTLLVGSTPPPIRNVRFHVVFPRSVNAAWKHGFVWALCSIWESGLKHKTYPVSFFRISAKLFFNVSAINAPVLSFFVCFCFRFFLLRFASRIWMAQFFLWSIQWMELDWIPFRIYVCFGVNTRFYNCSNVESFIMTEEPLNIHSYGSHYMNRDVLPLF